MNEVIGELLNIGVHEFVVCGGARNAPLVSASVSAAEQLEFVRVWKHFEERGAGFFALGRTVATQLPTAVIVTSGTAVAELLPSVMEAYYQQRPLILVTADRPPEYRGTGAPQAVDQVGIFSEYVESCVDVQQRDDLLKVCENWSGRGPLQINVCLPESVDDQVIEFPTPKEFQTSSEKFQVGSLAKFLREDIYLGVVVMLGGIEPQDREEVFHFCRDLGVPVIADASSGLRELLGKQVLIDGDAILKGSLPGKVLRIGDVPVGRFWRDLEDLPQIEVISITRTGFAGLARESEVICAPIGRVLRGLGEPDEIGDALDHFRGAGAHAAHIDELIEAYPASEPSFVRTLSVMATTGDSVLLGNSLPVREWGTYAQRVAAYDDVRAMRGVNGIDGQISYWLGSSADEAESWAVIGDLTTLYDVQGLALMNQLPGKRVLAVINNGGGQIFENLPRLAALSEEQKEAVVQPQDVDFSGLAKMWKSNYVLIESEDGFDQLDEIGDGLTIVEVVPDSSQTQQFNQRLKELRVRGGYV